MSGLPPCFGRLWQAIGDSFCVTGCNIRLECLQEFSATRLPEARIAVGPDGGLPELAAEIGVPPEAVLLAMGHSAGESPTWTAPELPVPANADPGPEEKPESVPKPKKKRERWGKKTWESRWLRERERSPAIGLLTPGSVLKRKYKGIEHTVKVLKGKYRWEAEEYPTLCEVAKAITGSANWSGTRFFGLAKKRS